MFFKEQKNIDLYMMHGVAESREQEYDDTVKNYIRYYHIRSRWCKNNFYFLSVVKIVALALIPVLQAMDKLQDHGWLVVALSGGGLLVDSLISLFHLKEKWQLYRKTCTIVSAEQRKFAAGCEPYHEAETAFGRYVKNVEEIISDESRKWSDTVSGNQTKKEKAVKKRKKGKQAKAGEEN